MELHAERDKSPKMATIATSSTSAVHIKLINENTTMQVNADARLMEEFEETGPSSNFFNYFKSVPSMKTVSASKAEVTEYLTKIQRGGFVQSFGCMLAIEDSASFKIIGFSENCMHMLGLEDLTEVKGENGLIGVDGRTFFTPSSSYSLAKAFESNDISLMNPILVRSRTNNKAFHAILHRIDVGSVIDLEPVHLGDSGAIYADALLPQKLVSKAVSRMQSLPGGDIGALCDTVVEEVKNLTGFDRVMVYKFHDDNHGEVISEIRRPNLDPYLGVHYPATDIPQAARFLFKQNHIRLIYDCRSEPVKVIQCKELEEPICLVNSTLRSPHPCHSQYMSNMESIATLVMAVIVNTDDEMKLWGLVACHHTSPRFIPFSLRYACEFLMQAFSLQLQTEFQKLSQLGEKKIFRVQTMLCEMLLHDTPFGIVTQSPNIMDLVRCDGAALYYGGKCWLLGVTPTESQLTNIVEWLIKILGDSTGLSTDSLTDAGYPEAALLSEVVCGIAAARITSSSFLFWFRSKTTYNVKWGGVSDDDKMHPKSSFNAFVGAVECRSTPWETTEINYIHSLQLLMMQEIEKTGSRHGLHSKPCELHEDVEKNELASVAVELERLIETAATPIFGVNSTGLVNGWNNKMCELIGLEAAKAFGKSLVSDVVHEDSREVVQRVLARALQGEEEKNVELKLLKFGANEPNSSVYILANLCTSRDYRNDVVGVCFLGQDITAEKTLTERIIQLQGDYNTLIQSANPLIPPIFAADDNAHCSEWNAAMETLTGWKRHEVIGKTLPGEIFGSFCQLKTPDISSKFMILLYRVISGHDTEKLAFGFFNRKEELVEVNMTASKREDERGNVIGCLCFLQKV